MLPSHRHKHAPLTLILLSLLLSFPQSRRVMATLDRKEICLFLNREAVLRSIQHETIIRHGLAAVTVIFFNCSPSLCFWIVSRSKGAISLLLQEILITVILMQGKKTQDKTEIAGGFWGANVTTVNSLVQIRKLSLTPWTRGLPCSSGPHWSVGKQCF